MTALVRYCSGSMSSNEKSKASLSCSGILLSNLMKLLFMKSQPCDVKYESSIEARYILRCSLSKCLET